MIASSNNGHYPAGDNLNQSSTVGGISQTQFTVVVVAHAPKGSIAFDKDGMASMIAQEGKIPSKQKKYKASRTLPKRSQKNASSQVKHEEQGGIEKEKVRLWKKSSNSSQVRHTRINRFPQNDKRNE